MLTSTRFARMYLAIASYAVGGARVTTANVAVGWLSLERVSAASDAGEAHENHPKIIGTVQGNFM